jgi:hypothetical protein
MIRFDRSYKNLFLVDDFQLRADALRHSIVPRLKIILQESLSYIERIYRIDPLADSRVSWFPRFRTNRVSKVNHQYEAAFAGIGPEQNAGKWKGFTRKDGKIAQLLPFRYGFGLDKVGLVVVLQHNWLRGLSNPSYRKLFNFLAKNESLTNELCLRTGMRIPDGCYDGTNYISTLAEKCKWMAAHMEVPSFFISNISKYPISKANVIQMIDTFVVFYPVYDAYIQLAMGKPSRFRKLIDRFNNWISERQEDYQDESPDGEFQEKKAKQSKIDMNEIRQAAAERIPVMPAIRWRVFQRDKWRCVACGQGSDDNVILHIDHIIPRSHGGDDHMDNYQTLCNICNLGKGNRDDTNLRILR